MPPWPYEAMIWRKRELILHHLHSFLNTQGHGGPPRMSDQLNAGATSETAQTYKTVHTIHAPIHSNDYDGQMIFGDLVGLKLSDICFTSEKHPRKPYGWWKPEKTSSRNLVPTGDRTRARCVTGKHATACSTAVNIFDYQFFITIFVIGETYESKCNGITIVVHDQGGETEIGREFAYLLPPTRAGIKERGKFVFW